MLLHVVGIGLGLTALVWPDRSTIVVGRLAGAALVVIAAHGVVGLVRARRFAPAQLLLYAAVVAVGAVLVAAPSQSEELLGRLLGAGCVLLGLLVVLRTVLSVPTRSGRERDRGWDLARGVALVSTGLLLVGFPSALLTFVVVVGGVAWVLIGAIALGAALDPQQDERTDEEGPLTPLVWLRERHDRWGAEPDVGEKLLFGPPFDRPRVARFVRFVVLMVLAAGISSMGVIADSTAVVIGAMLVAPLMTPLMGMAYALVVGSAGRLGVSAAVAFIGVVLAIGVGLLLGLLEPTVIDVATNTQIRARSQPTIVDLLSAAFAGAAGAYGLSRTEVSDSLPGVAIAISLVPPLTVTGIAWSQEAWSEGNGSLLLFLTNLVAILIVGGATFAIVGAAPLASMVQGRRRLRTWLAALWALTCFVVAALLLNGAQIAGDLWRDGEVRGVVQDWLDESPDHQLQEVTVDGDRLEVVIVGPPGPDLDPDELAASASDALDRDVEVTVRVVVEERLDSDD